MSIDSLVTACCSCFVLGFCLFVLFSCCCFSCAGHDIAVFADFVLNNVAFAV